MGREGGVVGGVEGEVVERGGVGGVGEGEGGVRADVGGRLGEEGSNDEQDLGR